MRHGVEKYLLYANDKIEDTIDLKNSGRAGVDVKVASGMIDCADNVFDHILMKDTIITFKLHYGGVLVRVPITQYRDYDYVSMDKEKNHVCLWSFTTKLRSLGFKDCDVNGAYYKEPLKTLTDDMKLIYDQGSLYDMFPYASRTGVVELNVEHIEEWLRTNNKLVDYETTSTEEDDHEEDVEAKLDTIIKTLCSNQDTEATDGIDAVREHYKALNQNRLIPTANIPEKELHLGNEENDNFKGSAENYLDNTDVESLDEEILEDGTTQMIRMLALQQST
ncbi:hypothetical protein Tco_0583934 [Tanacetum coccineum]